MATINNSKIVIFFSINFTLLRPKTKWIIPHIYISHEKEQREKTFTQ